MNTKFTFFILVILSLILTFVLEKEAIDLWLSPPPSSSDFKSFLVQYPLWSVGITFSILTLALYNIFSYLKNFDKNIFVQQTLLVLLLVFFAFNWRIVLTHIE